MYKNINIIKTLSFALIFPFVLAGCHTIEGAGTDIKQAGKSIEHAAEDVMEKPCPPQNPCPAPQPRYRRSYY